MNVKRHKVDNIVSDNTIKSYFQALDCPRSLSLYLLYKYKEFDQIVNMECNPLDFNNPVKFRDAYLATNFLLKNRFLRTSYNTKERALEKFWQSEAKCKETNLKWKYRRELTLFDWNSIHRVSEKIFRILGHSPNVERAIDMSSWGPGASLSIKKRDSSSYKKFSDERGITVDAQGLCSLIPKLYPLIPDRIFEFELGDRIVVVPKNAKIDRVILIQPGWNLWFQKGFGKLIRSKLAQFGLHLDNADKINQNLARSSSIDGKLATIDFSSASDQIAIEPLREVLPPNWFNLLDGLRCKRSADGIHTWEKFSSMGNGFTFELETLIFYSIALVSCDIEQCSSDNVSVFGDDTILPSEAVDTFRRICELFGFSFNASKSFSTGSFRESCGEHYFDGVNCKPYYFKEIVRSYHQLYTCYNSVRLLSHRECAMMACSLRWKHLLEYLVRQVPKRYRLFISHGYGDVGFISNFDEARPSKARFGYEGYFSLALISKSIQKDVEGPSLLSVRLTEHSDVSRNNAIEIKGRVRIFLKKILVHEWYDLGPWVNLQ